MFCCCHRFITQWFKWVFFSLNTTSSRGKELTFSESNPISGEQINATICLSLWIWMKQIQLSMRDQDLIRVFYQITMTMSFNNSPRVPINPLQSCHIGGLRGSGQSHEGFQWDRLGGEKNEWSRMSSCDLIWFSITVSSNHSEWRDVMKGCWRSDEQMKEFCGEERDGVVAWCGCVWNVMKPGTSLRVFQPPHSKVIV